MSPYPLVLQYPMVSKEWLAKNQEQLKQPHPIGVPEVDPLVVVRPATTLDHTAEVSQSFIVPVLGQAGGWTAGVDGCVSRGCGPVFLCRCEESGHVRS